MYLQEILNVLSSHYRQRRKYEMTIAAQTCRKRNHYEFRKNKNGIRFNRRNGGSCRCILRCAVPSRKAEFPDHRKQVASTFHSEPGKNKKAAALTNRSALRLPVTKASAIIKACDEIVEGKFCDEFIVDAIQAVPEPVQI